MKTQFFALAIVASLFGVSEASARYVGNQFTGTGTADHSFLPTQSGNGMSSASRLYKVAIVNGQAAAIEVLNGAEATDLFLDAKGAAEEMLDTSFANDVDAARVIIELAEQFQKAE